MSTDSPLIIGIETSCDETALSVVRSLPDGRVDIISEQIASQVDLHALYGGVVPELASREHFRALPLLYATALQEVKEQGYSESDFDLVAVTQGPGLKGCLLVGLQFSRGLSYGLNVPLMGVNHLEAHLLSPMIAHPELRFPFLGVVVSGGHSEIHLVEELNDYTLICRTSDDAAGEAFDKIAFASSISSCSSLLMNPATPPCVSRPSPRGRRSSSPSRSTPIGSPRSSAPW